MHSANHRFDAVARARQLLFQRSNTPNEYPVEALGPLASVAREIAEGVQCDPALAGQSVLTATALLTQSVANVRSADGGIKPLSLYALSIAGSGDGKDSAERVAFHAIKEWQRAAEKSYRMTLARLAPEERKPPEPYRIANDITIEGLRRAFHEGISSQGVFATEAGVMLAGHAMNPENRLKTVASLCRLWDGGHLSVVRAGAERFERYGLRLSMHLMVQPTAAAESLADDRLSEIGFWPRFLLAWPAPLKPRQFRPFQPDMSHVISTYWRRCDDLLKAPLTNDNDMLPVLELDRRAAAALGKFFEECELHARRGEWQQIAPFALRGAELAVRISGVQCVYRGSEVVDAETIERAIMLVRYSLENWHAVKHGKQVDPAARDAAQIYEWLLACAKPVKPSDILRVGPSHLRSKGKRDAALERLIELGLVAIRDGAIAVAAPTESPTANPANFAKSRS